MQIFRKLRIYISIINNLIVSVVIRRLPWSQNRVYFVDFSVVSLLISLHTMHESLATLEEAQRRSMACRSDA
jgi:hypothetical protein